MYWVSFGGGAYLGSSRRMPVQNDIIFGSFQVELVRFSTDFDNFLPFFLCQQTSLWKFLFLCVKVQATESGGARLSEKRKKIKKKHSDIRYKKEHFDLLNNVYHGDKDKINNSIFEHKTPSSAECSNGPKFPSSLAR
jgi:hypothetical protein